MSAWESIVASHMAAAQIKTAAPIIKTEKHCPGCGQVKPRSDFYTRSTHSESAISTLCKPCHVKKNTRKRRAK